MKGRDEAAQELSQAKAELALMTGKNAELMEEVRVRHGLHMCVLTFLPFSCRIHIK